MTTRAAESVAGRRLAVVTLLLGCLTAFGPLSMDLYLPAFPQLAADLHATEAQVQLTLTAGRPRPRRRPAGSRPAVGRLGAPAPAPRLDRGLCPRLAAVRARPLGCGADHLALRAGLRGGRGHRPRSRGRLRPDDGGRGSPAVLAVHDPLQRRPDRRAGGRRCAPRLDGGLAGE